MKIDRDIRRGRWTGVLAGAAAGVAASVVAGVLAVALLPAGHANEVWTGFGPANRQLSVVVRGMKEYARLAAAATVTCGRSVECSHGSGADLVSPPPVVMERQAKIGELQQFAQTTRVICHEVCEQTCGSADAVRPLLQACKAACDGTQKPQPPKSACMIAVKPL